MESVKNKTLSEGDPNSIITDMILENFTKEELEGKKGFTWEESFKPGYYIESISTGNEKSKIIIGKACNTDPLKHFKNQFRTEKQALSALAFSQPSHIVEKYNEGKYFRPGPNCRFVYWEVSTIDHIDGIVRLLVGAAQTNIISKVNTGLKFSREEDAITSMNVNKELWEQYWMI